MYLKLILLLIFVIIFIDLYFSFIFTFVNFQLFSLSQICVCIYLISLCTDSLMFTSILSLFSVESCP